MAADTTRYVMLMASLPPTGRLFEAGETPISRIRLEQRLTLLDEPDAATLRDIENVLRWDRLPMARTDSELLAAAEELLLRLRRPVLREVIEHRLELRTIVAALRRRQRGEGPPEPSQPWGWRGVADVIRRNWADQTFGLGGSRPWIADAGALLAKGDSMALERLLVTIVWTHLERLSRDHLFDFEAVVLYVLRWDLIHRRATADRDAAVARFDRMVQQGLGEFADLFAGDDGAPAVGGVS